LGVVLFAVAKAMIVFGVTLLLAWATTTTLRSAPFCSWLIGEGRRVDTGAILPGRLRPAGVGMTTITGSSVCQTLNGSNRSLFAETRDATDP
jgi:hypothetical protein